MSKLFPSNTFVSPQYPKAGHDLVRLVIGEAPVAEEADAGQPFIGGSGKVLNKLLSAAGIDREGLTITNCIQCRPPDNVFPTDAAARKYISKEAANASVQQCLRNHVVPLLNSRNWKRVDLLGDKPLRLVGNATRGVSTLRGSPLSIPVNKGKVLRGLATFHPIYLMRDQSMLPVAVNDLTKDLDEPEEHYSPFPSIEEVRAFTSTTFAFDIECPRYKILGDTAPAEMVGLCSSPTKAMCVPIKGEYISELKRIFRNAKVVIGHNSIQFDTSKLADLGIRISPGCIEQDTMLLQHLLFPDFPHDLEFVGSQFTSKPAWKADKDVLQTYCCRDTDVTFMCWQQLLPMIEKEGLYNLYHNVQVPMAKICSLMHKTGFKINTGKIKEVREKLIKESEQLEKDLPEFLRTRSIEVKTRRPAPPGTIGKSGKPLKFIAVPSSKRVTPWRSPGEKQRFLYSNDPGCIGMEPILDLKSGRVTTGKIALAKVVNRLNKLGKDAEVRAVNALAKLNKIDEIITTFAKEDMVKISRMYPHFNVHGTASGRLSSSDPNLQNIPESARIIYVPSHEGWKIVDVDYSQIENRLTAYFAGDTERMGRFTKDPKFSEHKFAASLFLGINYDDVVKDNDKDAPYGKAKRIVHGTNYGMGAKKIANTYDMDFGDTKKLQDTWKKAIWPTIQWQNRCGMDAKENGFLKTPFDRKRWFWTSSYYTEALSFLPQSTAADVIFRAMIGLMYERIGLSLQQAKKVTPVCVALPKPANLLIQVHDSLVLECPPDIVEELTSVLKTVMEQPWPELQGMSIPIGIRVGNCWYD
jgi:uracil-DNA glycosylase family 4